MQSYRVRASARRRSSSEPLSRNAVGGGAALAGAALAACAWILFANPQWSSVEPQMARFQAPAASAAAEETPVALLDPIAMGTGTSTFVKGEPKVEQLASLEPYNTAPAREQAAPAPEPTRVEQITPLPAPRPAQPQVAAAPPPAKAAERKVASLTPPQLKPVPDKPAASKPKTAKAPADKPAADKPAADRPVIADKPSADKIFEKLFGNQKEEPEAALAYAPADGNVATDAQAIKLGMKPPFDRFTAVYDISAHTVYMPDGTKLEAHSGLGNRFDDPRYVSEKMRGATPPHVYTLRPREAIFHGVWALRLIPIGGEEAIFGRTGLLAHTYMLGPRGDSFGCISFKNYDAFLKAYRSGQVKRVVVLARVE